MQELRRAIDDLRRRASATTDERDKGELEQEARDLLTEAKHTPLEGMAQELFAEIAGGKAPPPAPDATAIRGLARRARIRIEIAADDDDIDDAIDILADALRMDPSSGDIITLAQQAAAYSAQAKQRVEELFARHNVQVAASAQRARRPQRPPDDASPSAQPYRRSRDTSPAPAPPTAPPEPTQAEPPLPSAEPIDELLQRLTEHYYAGDYQQTIDVANRILALDAHNPTALEYREKAEDNLIRGIVPDHRIPFEARVAFNRANSLVRAGNYDQASGLYREARELAERDGILTWKDVEQALLDIQDLALARELMTDGDRLMANDHWSEALRKYEGALRVVPNDPQAEERLETVRRIQSDYDQISVNMHTIGGALEEQVSQFTSIRSLLSRARQVLPNSARLSQLQKDLDASLSSIRTQLNDQAQLALNHANTATTLDERVIMLKSAIAQLELGLELDPNDGKFSELLLLTRNQYADIERAQQSIRRAQALVSQNFDAELAQARQILADLARDYSQDERYRSAVNDLFTRYLERADEALQDGNNREARTWLEVLRDDPFRILGRRGDVSRIERLLRARRNRSRVVLLIFLVILLALGGVAAAMTRPQWEPFLFPTATNTATPTNTATATDTPTVTFTPTNTATATDTPTVTFTPTNTYTPTATYTPTDTPTVTATSTVTPTATDTPLPTATPTITPTPRVLCRVVVFRAVWINLRSRPTRQAQEVGRMPPGTDMDVLRVAREERNPSGPIWYYVRVTVGDATLEGWVRNDTVTNLVNSPTCPTTP